MHNFEDCLLKLKRQASLMEDEMSTAMSLIMSGNIEDHQIEEFLRLY
jgi:anthranilate phosphoribosyltransferase